MNIYGNAYTNSLVGVLFLFISSLFSSGFAAISGGDSQWNVPSNLRWGRVNSLLENETGLWVGTSSGLEQHDIQSGKLVRVWTDLDDLPGNGRGVDFLLSGMGGSIWIGIRNYGVAQRSAEGEWRTFTDLPNADINTLLSDQQGGVWVGTERGLLHIDNTSTVHSYDFDNSQLPGLWISALYMDVQGNLWVGTLSGLARRNIDDSWLVFTTENSLLPDNNISALAPDGQGGMWIGAIWGGLTHFAADGLLDLVNTSNSPLPSNWIKQLLLDGNGDLWVSSKNYVAYHPAAGGWLIFDPEAAGLMRNLPPVFYQGQSGLWVGSDPTLLRLQGIDLQVYDPEPEASLSSGTTSAAEENAIRRRLFVPDAQGGRWFVDGSELVYQNHQGQNIVRLDDENSELPGYIRKLISDRQNGLWVVSYSSDQGGLVFSHRSLNPADNQWEHFTLDSFSGGLLSSVNDVVASPEGGLWLTASTGEVFAMLAYLTPDRHWEVSSLGEDNGWPFNYVREILVDDLGNIWLAGYRYLLQRPASTLPVRRIDSRWQQINMADLGLGNTVNSMLADGEGGLWLATSDGLAHRDTQNTWRSFDDVNAGLPSNYIDGLQTGDAGDLWVNTPNGLAYIDSIAHHQTGGSWKTIDTENSNLPTNNVFSMYNDGDGGLWLDTDLGFGHLSFNFDLDDEISGKRAAIIIHARPQSGSDKQHIIRDRISGAVYDGLSERYYKNDDIYFLSYKPDMDVNGDLQTDKLAVDAPVTYFESGTIPPRDLTLADISAVFNWAIQQGSLGQALIISIIADADETGALLLNPDTGQSLSVSDLAALLDDYQQNTDNTVILLLESSHGGALLETLAGDKRILLTSTSAEQTVQYQDVLGSDSFLWKYFRRLRSGMNLEAAFRRVETELLDSGSEQSPQLEDSGDGIANGDRDGRMAQQYCLNGCFAPRANQQTYQNGDMLRLTVPNLPRNKLSYVGLALPDGQGSLLFVDKNQPVSIEEGFQAWRGSDMMLEMEVIPELQRGEYIIFLIRTPKGINPMEQVELWETSQESITIE